MSETAPTAAQTAIVDDAATATATLSLKAPLSGVLLPIERVPDPVLAQKMVGDGTAWSRPPSRCSHPVTARASGRPTTRPFGC
jgi:hypothetical protein